MRVKSSAEFGVDWSKRLRMFVKKSTLIEVTWSYFFLVEKKWDPPSAGYEQNRFGLSQSVKKKNADDPPLRSLVPLRLPRAPQ